MNKQIVQLRYLSKSKKDVFTVGAKKLFTLVLVAKQSADYKVQVNLTGGGARALILGFIIGEGLHTVKIYTVQNHTAPNTISDLHIKSVLKDQAFLQYEGLIKIEKDAQRSNAYQRNDNLLLSPKCKAESKPALEILANDVRCTHGATLGRIDKEQLFYLQSRGISMSIAEKLIISGFFQVLVDRISDVKVQNKVLKSIATYV